MPTVIKAINLRKEFDEMIAVAGINFSIEEGIAKAGRLSVNEPNVASSCS